MNNKKPVFKLSYVFLLLVLVLAIMLFFSDPRNKKDKLITAQSAIEMINDGEISDMYAYGNEVRLKKASGSIAIKDGDFPSKFDFYIDAVEDDIKDIKDAIILYNATNSYSEGDAGYVAYNIEPVAESWFDILMPVLYIGFAIFVIVLIFKMFSSNGKSAMTFGKSRAKPSVNVKVRFSDIAGADEEKEELAEIVEFLKTPQKFVNLGARIPKGILLVGNPGTGKTLLARAIAGESNVPFLSISGSDFVEMFVGVGASRVRDLFEQAKRNAPCIVFIDEIDAVGRQRGAGMGGGNDEREQTLNQLLVEMDGFEANEGIIVLAATNRADVLDPALLRPGRFDRQIYVHLPDVKGREGILKIHAKNKPLDSEIDFTTLARITSGFSGADLENMLNEAAILAARANRPKIIMQDITEGINKVIMGPQKKSLVVTDRDKKITAYHEAGHAILGKKLKYCEEVQEVSIIPRGMAAGYTMSRPDNDDNHLSYNKLNDMIAMTMGGRIAEELYMEDISTGASNDIKKATELARKMVTEWGMSEKFGFMNLGESQEVFLGRDYQTKAEFSEQTAADIDNEVKKILDKNYARAKKILKENEDIINTMSAILLEKETIYKEEVDMILGGKTKEEVVLYMHEQERSRKDKENSYKKELEKVKKIQELENKVKTAEMYLKNGIISKDDYNKVVQQKEFALKQLEEEEIKEKEQNITVDKKADENKTKKKVVRKSIKTTKKPDDNNEKPKSVSSKKTQTKSSKKVEEPKDE